MRFHQELPVAGRPVVEEADSHELAEETPRADPELALSRAQARDRRWREVRSRRLQGCIDGFARIEWLGYAITEPVVLWTTPLLFLGLFAFSYYREPRIFPALAWSSTQMVLVFLALSLFGWAIRSLGYGLRKLSLHWGDEQAIEVRDPGAPGE